MILRRIGVALAVGALVLVSIATGSSVAYAAIPGPPTIQSLYTPWVTTGGQPIMQGSMEDTVFQVDVYVTNEETNNELYCTMIDSPGPTVWNDCIPTTTSLAIGDNYLVATATNTDGTSAPSGPITITRVPPPTVTSPATETYTNNQSPSFTGTAIGPTVDVYAPASPDTLFLCSAIPVVGGEWSCTSGEVMPEGDYQVMTESGTTDGSGGLGPILHIDTTDPGLTDITGPPGTEDPSGELFSSTTDASPTISGTGEPFATIKMYQNYSVVGCVGGPPIVDAGGNWSCTLATPLPSPGIYVFGSNQFDRAGNPIAEPSPDPQLQLDYTDVTAPAPPVVTSPIGNEFGGMNLVATNNTTPTVFGTGEPGATLDIVGNTCMVVPTIVDGTGNWSCQLTTPMTPDGDYDVHFGQTDAALNSSLLTSPFLRFEIDTVPPTDFELWEPTGSFSGGVTTATTSNPHPFISGFGEYGAQLDIYRNGSIPVACQEGPQFTGEGGFGCTVASALSPGTYNFGFTQVDQAGNSSGSPVIYLKLTVLAPPPPTPTPTPTPTPSILWTLAFSSDNDAPNPGQNIVLTGNSLPVGATVVGELHSDPVPLGTTVVKDDGTFTLNTHIPNTVEPGDHHYVVTVTPLAGEPQTVEIPVTVVDAPESAVPPPPAVTEVTLPPIGSGGSMAATADRSEPAAPNTLSQSLPTLQDVLGNPVVIAAAAGSSLALLFLVALPAELLNSTLDENYQRLFGRIRRPKLPWLERLRNRLRKTPVVGGLALTTLAALILSFSDPRFGFDLTSLRLLLACAIGMFVLGWIANLVTSVILQRRWSIASVIELQPFGLVVALAGVVLSRLIDFAPGLLVGLVLTLSLSASASLKDEAKYVLTWAGVILGLSIIGWLGYSFFSGIVAPDTFGGALVGDTFVAVATEGISALVIGLLPIGFLDGRSLYRHSRLQWLGTYLVALVAFFAVVVPSGALWGDIQGPFWIWLAVLLAFAALCVGVYLWFRAHPEPEDDAVGDGGSAEPAGDFGPPPAARRERETVSR